MQGAQLEPQMGSGGYLFMMTQLLALSQGWMVSAAGFAAISVNLISSLYAAACICCRRASLRLVHQLSAAAADSGQVGRPPAELPP